MKSIIVDKCKWKNGSESPVVLMVDDLANKWIDLNRNKKLIRGADWGACKHEDQSFWSILYKEIIKEFPYIKATLFLVVGRREGIVKNGNEYYSKNISEDRFEDFLNKINKSSNIEIAYHGYTHGTCGEKAVEFKEEWEIFNSVEEACETIDKAQRLYNKCTERKFTGGKYCGYKYNDFSDKSINESGFEWWCRHWDAPLVNHKKKFEKGLSLEVEYFDKVIDIPSTIDGSFYTLKNYKKLISKKYLKSIYYCIFKNITLEKQLKYLIENNLIISIQEHTARYRVDYKIQYPNIVDDLENIRYILKYLSKYNLWYATCDEIARYYKAYSKSYIKVHENKITIKCDKEAEGLELSISIPKMTNKYKLIYKDNIIEPISVIENKQIFNIILKNNDVYKVLLEDEGELCNLS